MADESSFFESITYTSEEAFDYNCSSCLEENECNAATKYCVNCGLYYCKKCLNYHNKFPTLKPHRMQNVTYAKKPESFVVTEVTEAHHSVPCRRHSDEVIKMYCSRHDVVCCTVCIALDHRDCKGVDYIPKVAKDIRTNLLYTDYLEDLRKIKKELQETIQGIQEELQRLSEAKDEMIKDIKRYKNELIDQLDKLEAKSIEKVNERYKEVTKNMKEAAFKSNELLDEVATSLNETGSEVEAELFIRMKTLHKKDIAAVKTGICSLKGLNLTLNKRVQYFLDATDELVETTVPCTVTVKKKYNVSFGREKHLCSVSDICVLDDGTLVLADIDSLKRLNASYNKIEKLDVVGQPYGICKTPRSNEIAVTLREAKTVQFVSYTAESMSFKQTFRVGAPCKGICLVDRQFFITCGGGDEDQSPGQIRRYDMSGALLGVIEYEETGCRMFTSPRHLTLGVEKSKIFVADRDNGIIVLDKTGKKQGQYKHVNLKGAYAVSTSMYGNFVSGYHSDNIQQFDENLRFVGTVLKSTDGLNSPLRPCITKSGDQMLISIDDSDSILLGYISAT